MFEISWFAFYLLLHLLLSAAVLPVLLWLSRQAERRHYAPALLLKGWYLAALCLFVVPALLLQPWALDSQLMPWFHQSVQQASGTAESAGPYIVSAAGLSTDEPGNIYQLDWPLASQLIDYLAPGVWFWWLLPIGSLCCVVRLVLGYQATRRLAAQACPLPPALLLCPLPLKVHPAIPSAMLVGIRRPQILLPSAYLQQLTAEQLAVVLAHEVCHQQQGDLRSYCCQQLVGVFCWWSPGWHRIAAELNRWRELRCDALVSRNLNNPLHYAQILLDCALLPQQPAAVLAQHWWQQPLLASRVDALLGTQRQPHWWWYAALLSLVLALASACWLAQQWQLIDLPSRHAKVRLSELTPLRQLMAAVRQQDVAAVRRLLQQGAPLNIAMPGDGTALMLAVRMQQPFMVELLLAGGADVNVSSRGDGNALIIAVQNGDLAMAQRLLAAGADVNAAVLADETALINASMRANIPMAELLLASGAVINLQVRTPLSDGHRWRSALNQAGSPQMRDFLLSRGAR